jgi:uncharacterized GH25 family protein
MKGKKMKKHISCLALILFLALAAAPAGAHMLWLNPADCYPAVGGTVEIGIGWGHEFTANRTHEEVKPDRVEAIQALDPDGAVVQLEKAAVDRYRLKIEKAGAYIVTARIKPGFFTMTPEGRKWGNKKEIPNATKCTHFQIEAKTVLIAGGDARNKGAKAGQPLELIPVTDSTKLKAGGAFAAELLYEGKPLADATVKAVYAGYQEPKSEAPPGAEKQHGIKHYPVEATTDAQGRVEFKPDRAGHWLIILSHKPAYPDKETCDESMYNVTYAMEVK